MTHLETNEILIAFNSLLKQHGATKEDYPYFRVKKWYYGTHGYTYTVEGYSAKRKKWIVWGKQFPHYELVKYFRTLKPAEQVLYGPF